MNSATIVQRLWTYCNALRDDGMSKGGNMEQLTYGKARGWTHMERL
jgi:type I restriction enzyme M protein